ncbi:hypothetical protein PhaeoP83_04269 (plasmid) [Phaeobacter inhibens]|uniref:Uncharacterized protein n=1 Tax=Phaeobacter inhibens TaxID=221822 RepID=A0ABN5GUT8_9RHOB|nr:hypothetical protein PhaeoP83_04269 [Phaeobacter inhibens]AUQ97092.1 hypothetical protein PhaeoP66_04366 [Phaeobacter inhibens]AUR22292.1 hypothetical protein PhaeoP80_04269 [Phaeobacter inhibens]
MRFNPELPVIKVPVATMKLSAGSALLLQQMHQLTMSFASAKN